MLRASLASMVLVLACACASAPPEPLREGEEDLDIVAVTWTSKPDLFAAPGPLRVPERLEGVQCTLSNDKGTWKVTVPSRVKVRRSAAPLAIDCAGEGFSPWHEERRCVSERERNYERQKVEMPLTIALLPLAIAAAPVAPGLALQAGSQAAIGAAGMAGSHIAASSRPDVCSYGRIWPAMWRR